MPAEESKKASVAFDRAKAVQDQQRASAAAAQDLELEPVDNQPLGLGIGHPALPPTKLAQGMYSPIGLPRNRRSGSTSSPAEQVPHVGILKGQS